MATDSDFIEGEIEEKKSKSQLKREMLALQKLGERLVDLSVDQIKKIEMPQDLRDAVLFAKSLKKHGARRRQMQYIGVLMREVDPALIQERLEDILQGQHLDVAVFHQIEYWRTALVDGNDALLADIVDRYPDVDRQYLHQLVRNARKEKVEHKAPKFSRALFRYLKALYEKGKDATQ